MQNKKVITTKQYSEIFENVFRVPKYGGTEWVPFELNNAQRDALTNFHDFNIILKARKLGFSSLIAAYTIVNCYEHPSTKAVMLADTDSNTIGIFEKIKDLITHCNPSFDGFKNVICEKKKVEFENGSTITVATAGRKSAFRGSDTQIVHLSEIAFFEYPDVFEAVLESCAKGQAKIFCESTANGKGNLFFDLWQTSQGYPKTSNFKSFFYGWSCHPDNFIEVDENFKLTKDEEELKTKFNLSKEQLAWKRWKLNSMPNPDKFPQEFPLTPSEAFISSGSPVFDLGMLDTMKNTANLDYRHVDLIYNKSAEIAVQENQHGIYKIFEMPKPGKLYCIGADSAEGLADGDFNAACVLDTETNVQVAELHCKSDPDTLAYELNKLGRFYNTALIAPERNNTGYTVIRCLVNDYAYPNLYQEETNDDQMIVNPTENYGFRTNIKTRQIIIDLAKMQIRKGLVKINSIDCLAECSSFVYSKSGKAEADKNKHDDLVFALMIAMYVNQGFNEYASKRSSDISIYTKKFEKKHEEAPKRFGVGGY